MRVLYFVECFWPYVGGVEVVSATVLPRLARRGIEVTVVTFRDSPDLAEREEYEGLDVRRVGSRVALWTNDIEEIVLTRRRVAAVKRDLRPDIVHAVLTGPGILYHVTTADACAAPTVLSFHGTSYVRLAEKSLLRRAIEGSTWVTGCSDAVLGLFRGLDEGLATRSSLLPNGLDPPPFEPGPVRHEPPVLLCAARLSREKGIDVAVDALPLVQREFPAARLVIAGGGPAKVELADQAARLGVATSVELAGWASPPAVSRLIDRATVVLVPSRSEGFGLFALQGMLGGRPVVASRVGGLPEVLGEDGGLLVEPDDPAALAAAIVRVLRDPALAARLADAGRARARERFPLDRSVDAHEDLYRRLAASGRAS